MNLADVLGAAVLAYAGGTTPGIAQGYNQFQETQKAEKQKQLANIFAMLQTGYQPYQQQIGAQAPTNVIDFPVTGPSGQQRYWQPTSKIEKNEPEKFLKYFKPLTGKLEAGEKAPAGAVKAPAYMKELFPEIDYYMYQAPKVVDFSSMFQ